MQARCRHICMLWWSVQVVLQMLSCTWCPADVILCMLSCRCCPIDDILQMLSSVCCPADVVLQMMSCSCYPPYVVLQMRFLGHLEMRHVSQLRDTQTCMRPCCECCCMCGRVICPGLTWDLILLQTRSPKSQPRFENQPFWVKGLE